MSLGPSLAPGPDVLGRVHRLGHREVGTVHDPFVGGARSLGGGLNQCQGVGVAQVPGPVGGRQHHGGGAVVFLAEVQHVEGLGHHPRALVVVDGDGVAA